MRPLPLRALLLFSLAGAVHAGQIEGPVSGQAVPGTQSGAIGSSLAAPTPVQMTVPSLTGALSPNLAPALAPAPSLVPAVAVQAQAAKPMAVPVLPNSVMAPAAPDRAAARGSAPSARRSAGAVVPAAAGAESDIDGGRILFDRGSGEVRNPNQLPVDIYSPEIMAAAREAGIVYELTPESLKRMKPGVEHNFVIARNPDGTIVMTVGRLAAGNVKETGVKHVALGDGRAVLFSGAARVDPATGRPTLDFNSGMYSQVGLDPRWAPTPENARTLAAQADAILRTPIDVVDHLRGRPIEFRTPRSIVRRGASRGEGWEVDGMPARRLSGGSFKEVLIHPSDQSLVIKIFSEIGAKDAAGSLSEKRLELRHLQPLLRIGRAPQVVEQGALELRTPSSGGKKITGYIIQERVIGRELGDMLRDSDRAVRSRALKEARSLFEDLIAARIKLEDRVKMHENISVGRAGKSEAEKAWVLDAGEATLVAERGMLDKLLDRPDPLRAYYDSVLADLIALPR